MRTTATPAASPHVARARRARESQMLRVRTLAMTDEQRAAVMWVRILSRAGLARFRPGELSAHLGMTPEEASSTLQHLRQGGLITADSSLEQVDIVVPVLEAASERLGR